MKKFQVFKYNGHDDPEDMMSVGYYDNDWQLVHVGYVSELIEVEYYQPMEAAARLVTIYYNDVFVSEVPNEIYANCPYVNVPIDKAIEYADNKIDNREWDAYCIPELIKDHKVVFHD